MGYRGSERPAAHTQQKLTKVTPPHTLGGGGGQSSAFTFINKGNLHYELRNSFS